MPTSTPPQAVDESKRRRRHSRAVMICLVLSVGCVVPRGQAEPFIGQFELKTLESEPGSYEFQSQNAWAWNQPPREIHVEEMDALFDENSVFKERYAVELEMGLTRRLKMRVGIEFEKERLDDPATIAQANDFGALELGEIGVEVVGILIPREGDGFALGVVTELEGPPDQEESNSVTFGSILEYRSGRWLAAAVPMLVHSFGGEAEDGEKIDNKWDFAYAAQLMHEFSDRWSLALEGYGTVERLGNSGRPSDAARHFGDFHQHRAGLVLYHAQEVGARDGNPRAAALPFSDGDDDDGASLTIGLGLLEGLNGDTPDHTLKLSIELDF